MFTKIRLKRAVRSIVGLPENIGLEELSYRRLAQRNFNPAGIIDVGAYQGEWTKLARKVFPDAPILMVEAQDAKKTILEKVCAERDKIDYASAVLGAKAGEIVTFFEMETGSSFFPERSNAPRTKKTMVTTTLDEITGGLPANNLFLKIDVQGAELEVIAGGLNTLKRCSLVQLEVAVLKYNEGAPTMLEVLSRMEEQDFIPFDISGESRPMGHLVQIDMLFVPRNSSLRPEFITF